MAFIDDILATSPWLHWRLGEASGTTAQDATTNNRDGTYFGSPTLDAAGSVAGDADTAVGLDGVDDLVLGPSFNAVNWTFAARVKIAANPSVSAVLMGCSNGTGSSGDNREVFINASGLPGARIWDGSSEITVTSSVGLSLGDWHYVFVTEDGTNLKIYVDGVQTGSVACAGAAEALTFHAGGATQTYGRLTATIDEVSAWTTALSSTTISSLARSATATLSFSVRLTGGATNTSLAASIGGAESSTSLVLSPGDSGLLRTITNAESIAGITYYRCVSVRNEEATAAGTVIAYISGQLADTPQLAIGVATQAAGVTVTAIANETTAPAGVTFSEPASSGAGISLGSIPAGDGKGLWLRTTIPASTPPDGTNPWQVTLEVTPT